MLERDAEITALETFVDGIERTGPRLMLIEGPAGIGKSTLLAEARRLAAEDGLRMLVGRGSLLEREFPFGVVRQMFEPDLADQAERERLLSGAAEAAAPVFSSVPGETGGDASFAALHGLYWLTMDLAGDKPLLLVVDDLHWVDHPSLRFLSYLVRRLESVQIAIAAATRPNEPGADAALIAELAGDPLATSIRPGGLSPEGVRGVIEQRLGTEPDDSFSRACHSATGGNPLLLHELLKAIAVEGTAPTDANADVVSELGPRAASRAVLLRLSRLSPDAGAVARAAAVLDEGFDVASVAALANLDETVAARATGELSQAEILRPSQPLGFVHPLIRAAIYQEISPGERELAHTAAARMLAESGAPVERVASHLLEVPPHADEWAFKSLREAARQAMKKGAADSAVAYFRRALAEPPPDERKRTQTTLELGLVESLTYAPAAVEHLREAYDGLDDPAARGLAANVLARSLLWNSPQDAAALARDAAASMPPEQEDQRLALQAFEAATMAFGVDVPEAIERAAAYRDRRPPQGLGEKAMAAAAAWYWTHSNGPLEDCVDLGLGALSGGELIAADGGLLPVYAIDPADSRRPRGGHGRMGADACRRPPQRFDVRDHDDPALARLHALPARRPGRGRAVDARRGRELPSIRLRRERNHLRRRASRRDPHRARRPRECSSRARSGIRIPEAVDAARYWLQAKMGLLLAEGKPEEVLEIADELPRRLPWMINPTDAYWRSYKALALDKLDRTDEAIELVNEELKLARDWGAPATVGRVLRVLGTIDRAERDRAPHGVDRAAREVHDPARVREGAVRAGHGDPPRSQAERGPRAALPGARARHRVRRQRAGGASAYRAGRDGRAAAPRRAQRRRLADAV